MGMAGSGGRGDTMAARGPTAGSGSADSSYLLWVAGLAAVVLAMVAFVLWTRYGAGMLLDMMSAFCA
jgi:hypothetical protein